MPEVEAAGEPRDNTGVMAMKSGKAVGILFVIVFCASPLLAVERNRESAGRSEGRQSPGGAWGERSHQGGSSRGNFGQSAGGQGRGERSEGAKEFNKQPGQNRNVEGRNVEGRSPESPSREGAAGATRLNRNQPQNPEARGAAAGAAAANRNQPQFSGKQDAAAGAAAANRNQPQISGAQGAAAGAAAANRNQPNYSGAQGVAAGAAAANRNQPQVSGAEGAALGAAATNRNQPQLSGAQGAALGAAAANANAPQASGAQGAALGAAAARNSFNNYGLYGSQWSSKNAGAWSTTNWTAGNAWTPTNWQSVASYYGTTAAPVSYDYGNNVTYQNGNIIMNGQDVGTAEQFSQQAADLAEVGATNEPAADSQWLPLGVFGLVRNEQQHPHFVLQLAVNRQGMLRGNYTDEVTENNQPIRGAVDQKTQRAAWIVGDHKELVMEAGLSNLAQGDAPALIHKNGKTDHWLLVRLDQPQAGSGAAPGAAPAQ